MTVKTSEVKVGDVFGRLTVLEILEIEITGKKRQVIVQCSCSAKTIKKIYLCNLGKTVSCGCYIREHCSNLGKAGNLKVNSLEEDKAFWLKVNKTDTCWIWMGEPNSVGYGTIGRGGKQYLTHRYVYFMIYGKIPDGLFVCHHCDNRICVKPDHLFLGTALDNSQDMVRKGRQAKREKILASRNTLVGEEVPHSKLKEKDVLDIRARVASGEKSNKVAKEYNITPSTVYQIVKRKNWKHI